jgi:hypothetical protein
MTAAKLTSAHRQSVEQFRPGAEPEYQPKSENVFFFLQVQIFLS